MTISVIIPTFNSEAKNLQLLLESLKNQSVKIDEILVINSGSSFEVSKITEKYQACFYSIESKDFDHGGTRTYAGKIAKGEILVYLTQDVIIENEFSIENLTKYFKENKEIGATYGRQLPHKNASIFARHSRYFIYPPASHFHSIKDIKTYGFKAGFLSNAFAAYSKKALEDVGYFDDNIISSEDNLCGLKLLQKGYVIGYISDARVFHSHNLSAICEFKRYFDIGVFHSLKKELLKVTGFPHREGLKYVISEIVFLIKERKFHFIPVSLFRNIVKFIGYRLGRLCNFLPYRIVLSLTANKRFWERLREKK